MSATGQLFKIIIIGNDECGKSSLLLKYTDDTFTESYIPTIGIDFKVKMLSVSGEQAKLQMWDTAGQERFRTITSSYYRGTDGALIVYDVTDQDSFKKVENWIADIELYADGKIPKVLVANKCDLDEKRCVSKMDGESYAVINNIDYVETSAKTGKGVSDAFLTLLNEIQKQRRKDDGIQSNVAPVSLDAIVKPKKNKSVEDESITITAASVGKGEDVPRWAADMSKEIEKLKKQVKTVDKLENSVKSLTKQVEKLQKKLAKSNEAQGNNTQSKTCAIS